MATNVVDTEQTEGEVTEPAGDGTVAEFTVTAHLRASPTGAAARRQQSVLEELRELESSGAIPELSIERWGSRVNVPDGDSDVDDAVAVSLYDEFAAVADGSSIQLEPFFEERRAVSGLLSSGPSSERIVVFPVVAITIRREGDLSGLYPCWKAGSHESVEDCLGAFSGDSSAENLD